MTPAAKDLKSKWKNKQKVLVLAARGLNHRNRHLMLDLKKMMPHHRSESKLERTKSLTIINEMCEMKHCNKALLFEGRRKRDLYMWCSSVANGPSVKFLVENIHSMNELKMTGNCLRGTRAILSFDGQFKTNPNLNLIKEIFVQIFGVPNYHPKSQPFFDHVYTFTFLDNRIWFRNYQILSEDGALVEIGPRFVLNPVKIFDKSFAGKALWENGHYISPSHHRRSLKTTAERRYTNRVEQSVKKEVHRPVNSYRIKMNDDIFENSDVMRKAAECVRKSSKKQKRKKIN